MKRSLMLLSFATMLLSATWTNVQAQVAKIQNFHGTVNFTQKTISLAWWAAGDDMFISQVIETSVDGISFKPIAEIPVTGGADGEIYQYMHTSPEYGVNYYRLALMFSDGSHQYSETIKVDLSAPPIYTYPYRPQSGTRPRG